MIKSRLPYEIGYWEDDGIVKNAIKPFPSNTGQVAQAGTLIHPSSQWKNELTKECQTIRCQFERTKTRPSGHRKGEDAIEKHMPAMNTQRDELTMNREKKKKKKVAIKRKEAVHHWAH